MLQVFVFILRIGLKEEEMDSVRDKLALIFRNTKKKSKKISSGPSAASSSPRDAPWWCGHVPGAAVDQQMQDINLPSTFLRLQIHNNHG